MRFIVLTGCLAAVLSTAPLPASPQQAAQILQATGVSGGFVVQVGVGDGQLTAALKAGSPYQVHGLDRNPENVARARQLLHQKQLYGEAAVDHWSGSQLPYVDNLVNLLVIDKDSVAAVSAEEIQRVLAPRGVAYVQQEDGWRKIVKPVPDDIDDWTHYLHDSSGNAVAHDDAVGPPQHLQWVGSPRWSRHHDRMASMSALVSSGGRMFYIMDEGSRISIQMPAKWSLIARDAFNGVVLWKQPIARWQSHLWPLKSGPTQLARRLVAADGVVYATLSLQAPLTAMDAATGRILRTYEGTKTTEEMVYHDGVLFLLVNPNALDLSKYAPLHNLGDQRRVGQEWRWNEKPRQVMAVKADTGEILWKHETVIAPLTLSANGKNVYYHNGKRVICRDRKTGEQKWQSESAATRAQVTFNFGPKLVLYKNVVLFAGGDRKMQAMDSETGKLMWTAPHAQSGYQSPEDLLVASGLVWSAPTTRTGDSGAFNGRDPQTGEVKIEFPPDVQTYWFHHRCYISKATDRYLMPSRTGIEFVDPTNKHWDIHHWVRGGCLYGVMPCNGLLYAPPHNCACYPEAKLYGLNALAPTSPTRPLPKNIDDEGRLQTGPAFGHNFKDSSNEADWPTFRHDHARSGRNPVTVEAKLKSAWKSKLGGRLTSLTVADKTVYVAQIDQHRLFALDADNGETRWSFTAGGRIDSPPTYHHGRVVFGSADGWVYCLRASDGELVWRFRAAPEDRRLMAFEQLESVWPVHGTILIEEGVASFVAGRSNYLDGGLRFVRLNVDSGQKLSEKIIDEIDPESGENLQNRLQVLNMPAGLPDVLSSDGKYVYMRSQQFDKLGNRLEIGPHSGNPAEQGSVQRGETAHLFSPTGFLDGTWFHRSYWVYGRSFAGGHGGYYQAGKYAPGGRIMVFDDKDVYSFGRKPQYLKWTTTIEHQLYSASKEAPAVSIAAGGKRRSGGSQVQFGITPSLNPKDKPITVEAWVQADKPGGVILARGGPADGFALYLQAGKPKFSIRSSEKLSTVTASKKIGKAWTHIAGVLGEDKSLRLYINGELSAEGKSHALISTDPKQPMELGLDGQSAVGEYPTTLAFTGVLDEVNLYYAALSAEEIKARFSQPDQAPPRADALALACSFDKGGANDASGNKNHGKIVGARSVPGQVGRGMRFTGKTAGGGGRSGGSAVKPHWAEDLPLLVRSMTMAGSHLFMAGPPDLIDEEETFQRLTQRDPKVQELLAKQDRALLGEQGAILQVVSKKGETLERYSLPALPVWDGMAAARGKLYLADEDGAVSCFAKE